MITFLNRPAEIAFSKLFDWLVIIGVAVFVFFFLLIFRPFQVFQHLSISAVQASFGYAFITFICCLIFCFTWLSFVKKRIKERYKMKHHLMVLFLHITLIGILNGIFAQYIFDLESYNSFSDCGFFVDHLIFTHAIGFLPVVFISLVANSILTNHYTKKGASVSLPNKQVYSELKISISGDGREQKIELSSHTFRYAKSSGNYVEFFSVIEGEVRKDLQRITLANFMTLMNEKEMPTIKVHRSYVVNMQHVESVTGNAQGYTLKITELDEKIPVSRNNIYEFDLAMNNN